MTKTAVNAMNRDQLRTAAKDFGIMGRGKMTAQQLREAVRKVVQSAPTPLARSARTDNYRRQTGKCFLTPAQRRRADKKERKSGPTLASDATLNDDPDLSGITLDVGTYYIRTRLR